MLRYQLFRASISLCLLIAIDAVTMDSAASAADFELNFEEKLQKLDKEAGEINARLEKNSKDRELIVTDERKNISDRKEIVDQTNELLDKINKIRTSKVYEIYRNDIHGYLIKLLTAASASIGEDEVAQFEKKLGEKKSGLLVAVERFEEAAGKFRAAIKAPPPADDEEGKLTKDNILTILKKFSALDSDSLKNIDSNLTDTKKLVETILGIVPKAYPEPTTPAGVSEAAKQLKTVLAKTIVESDNISKPNAVWRDELYKDETAKVALVELQDTLAKIFEQRVGLVVRIEDAWVGDTPRLNRKPVNGRWCDSTAQLRARCDRQPKCDAPDNYSAELCGGFEAAPSASPTHRGLYVKYSCVANIESNFAGRYGEGSTGQTISQGATVFPGGAYPGRSYVVLRSKGAIQCAAK